MIIQSISLETSLSRTQFLTVLGIIYDNFAYYLKLQTVKLETWYVTVISLIETKHNKKIPVRFTGDIESFYIQLKQITTFRPDLKVFYHKTQSFLPELAFPKEFDNKNLLDKLQLKDIPENPIEELKGLFR